LDAALISLLSRSTISAGVFLGAPTPNPLADPKMLARLSELGASPIAGSPTDFGKLIADETEKWGKVVKFTGIKAD
jgi:hypothetical protein